ncbi:hypothetical protein CEXT_650451 [Caerostris extrusa]|uniref:Uncharacterized protein n=1 Tax=Caerostris extrusa TaxID=172846 RepID=A0AAV4WKJ9_CAEEX|nr:hypothetical protein CEXT_650451 [Caerostris extrusa]
MLFHQTRSEEANRNITREKKYISCRPTKARKFWTSAFLQDSRISCDLYFLQGVKVAEPKTNSLAERRVCPKSGLQGRVLQSSSLVQSLFLGVKSG